MSRTEPRLLRVGEQEVTLERAAGTVTERKVRLPERWLKVLTAVQGNLTTMEERLSLSRVQALQLLQGLPAGISCGD